MTEHVQGQPQRQTNSRECTFHDWVDIAIVFGGSPVLFLCFIFWAVATAFPLAGLLPSSMAVLITLLFSLLGVILVVRSIDVSVLSMRKAIDARDKELLMTSIRAGITCLFLVVSIAFCLSRISTLEGWHYTLITVEIVLVGYQTCVM